MTETAPEQNTGRAYWIRPFSTITYSDDRIAIYEWTFGTLFGAMAFLTNQTHPVFYHYFPTEQARKSWTTNYLKSLYNE